MESDGKDEKRHYNCVIWPENHESNEKRCVIHAHERRILLSKPMSSNLMAWPDQENTQYVLLSFFTMEVVGSDINAITGTRSLSMEMKTHRRFVQKWDKGGCYLDPGLIEGKLPWE